MAGKRKRPPIAIRPLLKAEKFKEFCRRYQSGESQISICRDLRINKNTGTAWAGTVIVTIGTALRHVGINEQRIARKLQSLLDAQMPKWNAGEEDWDYFEDGSLQLEAAKESAKFLDMYPAPKVPPPTQPPITVIIDMDCPRGTTEEMEAVPAVRQLTVEAES